MTYFVVAALVMLLLATVLIGWPWMGRRQQGQQDSLTNAQIFRQRLSELEEEVSQGVLAQQEKLAAEQELKLALLDEVEQQRAEQQGAGKTLVIGVVISLMIGAGIYYHANELDSLQHWQQTLDRLPELGKRVVMEQDQSITNEDLQDFALGIRTRLAVNPEDPTGWLLLGRLYASLNRMESAIDAFNLAYRLAPENPAVLNSYTQALVLTGQEDLLRKALPILQDMVKRDHLDANGFGLLAVTATQLGEKELAVSSWQSLQELIPQDDPLQLEIDKRLAELNGVALARTALNITVKLADELKGNLPKQGYLFVFAQDPSGATKMPAAVVKQPLSSLPVTIELSDANAMMPTFTLSQLKRARLIARVSSDENVAEAEGELQGTLEVDLQSGKTTTHTITINEELL